MPKSNFRFIHILLIGATVAIFAGCGGKEAVAPADVQEQAFEDLRTDFPWIKFRSSNENVNTEGRLSIVILSRPI